MYMSHCGAQSEKTALTIVLEESKEECEVYWKLLKEMNGQVHSLQVGVLEWELFTCTP